MGAIVIRNALPGDSSTIAELVRAMMYSAPFALKEGRTAVFITERAVLKAISGALEVIEVAPGIDLERDVLRHMAFRPHIAPDLKLMDKRLFSPVPMNLRADLDAKARSADRKEGIRRVS